jgi:hypothetical protein
MIRSPDVEQIHLFLILTLKDLLFVSNNIFFLFWVV